MSEPYWTPLGGQPVDYEGAWVAGTQYAPGDVVVYNGVTYLAVNPSLGTTPPANLAVPFIGTSLPAAPTDGMIFTLVDSLTAPTYQWRLQYLAAKATNKWLFIGGTPLYSNQGAVTVGATSTSYVDPTSNASITVPLAGVYLVTWSGGVNLFAAATGFLALKFGAAATSDYDAFTVNNGQTKGESSVAGPLAAATVLKFQHRTSNASYGCGCGPLYVGATPVAIGG